jgi:hypothetical protein
MYRTKRVYSKQIATELIKNGANLLKTMPNYKKEGYLVFVFADDTLLFNAWEKFNEGKC